MLIKLLVANRGIAEAPTKPSGADCGVAQRMSRLLGANHGVAEAPTEPMGAAMAKKPEMASSSKQIARRSPRPAAKQVNEDGKTDQGVSRKFKMYDCTHI